MRTVAAVKTYLELCRVSNLPSIWTNVLCALVLATGTFDHGRYLVLAVSLSCLYLAGMCLNDICDSRYDAIHRPSRPIPSGAITLQSAGIVTFALLTTGVSLLSILPFREGLYTGLILVAVIVWYDIWHKKSPVSVLLMASCRFLVFAVTARSVTGAVNSAVLIAGGVQFCYVIAVSLIARYENGRQAPRPWPVVPLMLAGICLIDGILLALLAGPWWIFAGIGGYLLMQSGQKFVRGD